MSEPRNAMTVLRAEILAPQMTSHFKMALPPHVKVERFQRVLMTSLQQTPALLECDRRSVIGEAMKAAQLGLLTDGFLGEAYLIVSYQRGGKVAQMRVGYKGLMKLARQSGEIANVYAEVVYSNDKFQYTLGLNRTLVHEPFQGGSRGEATHFYAVAKWRGDMEPDFVVMTLAEVNEIRDHKSDGYKAFKAGKIKSTPWDTDPVPMGKKTVIRALCKLLPQSPDLARALKIEDAADRGVPVKFEDGEVIAEPDPVEQVRIGQGSAALDAFDGGGHDPETGEIVDGNSALAQLNAEADDAASHGVDAYRAFWGRLEPAQCSALRPQHDARKQIAAAADAVPAETEPS